MTITESEEKIGRGIGHNVGRQGTAAEQLRTIIQRIERLEGEKADIAAHIRDVYAEAKGNGFDVKALRQIVKDRKIDQAIREEMELVVDTYKRHLGMLPLFKELEGEQG